MERINAEQPVIHELKIDNNYLRSIQNYSKRFEIRKDDRSFRADDYLMLREFNRKSQEYGNSWSLVKILYIFGRFEDEKKFVRPGYVVLSIEEVAGVRAVVHYGEM